MQLSDAEFARQFADCSLQPDLFTHAAHLRLAWILIEKEGPDAAAESLCAQIQAFDRHYGDGTKFDREMTLNAAGVVAECREQHNAEDFPSFLAAHPGLITDFRGMLQRYAATKA